MQGENIFQLPWISSFCTNLCSFGLSYWFSDQSDSTALHGSVEENIEMSDQVIDHTHYDDNSDDYNYNDTDELIVDQMRWEPNCN